MKCNYTILFLLITIFFIASCSKNSKKHNQEEIFVTKIEKDKTKIFSFSLVSNRQNKNGARGQRGKGGRGGRGGFKNGQRGQAGGVDYKEKLKTKLYKKLEITLIRNQYCRKGYIQLDSFFEKEYAQIKGKCNEKATPLDIKKFINQ